MAESDLAAGGGPAGPAGPCLGVRYNKLSLSIKTKQKDETFHFLI